tara:strand:+ start:2354 stop:2713 length:360 start_codon:yes stop_codon:yes gene_type:complete
MSLSRKTSGFEVSESGTLPGLPEELSGTVENLNWWFEVRGVLNRRQDEMNELKLPENIAFSTSTTSPFEFEYTHGIGRYPQVQVLDSSNEVLNVTIKHNSVNSFTVSHSSALTGTIIIH